MAVGKTSTATHMEDGVASAERTISNWLHSAEAAASETREDLRGFLAAVRDLHHHMSSRSSTSAKSFHHSQHLLHDAVKHLEAAFHRLLDAARDVVLDSGYSSHSSLSSSSSSLSDNDDSFSNRVDADLSSIAHTMIAVGYAKECVATYKKSRRAVLETALRRIGFEPIDHAHFQKLDTHAAGRRIKHWIAASRGATRTVFATERALCDSVFALESGTVGDSCFAEVARDLAVRFFAFPEIAAGKAKRSPGGIFQLLDMHGSILRLRQEIEVVFGLKSTHAVLTQVESTMNRLAEVTRSALAEFEEKLQHESSKSAIAGVGIHPLTERSMDYLSSLADRAESVIEIFAGDSLPPARSVPSSPDRLSTISTIHEEAEDVPPEVSSRFAWLLLALLCKLDGKAGLYRDAAASYLFLVNNLHYIVGVVRGSGLATLIGREWVARHEGKVRSFAGSFERVAWEAAVAAIPTDAEALGEPNWTARFEKAFEECRRRQAGLVIASGKLRGEIKDSIARKVLAPYRAAYDLRDGAVSGGLEPEEVRRRLASLYQPGSGLELLAGSPSSDVSGSISRSEHGSGRSSRWRSALMNLGHRKKGSSHHHDHE